MILYTFEFVCFFLSVRSLARILDGSECNSVLMLCTHQECLDLHGLSSYRIVKSISQRGKTTRQLCNFMTVNRFLD